MRTRAFILLLGFTLPIAPSCTPSKDSPSEPPSEPTADGGGALDDAGDADAGGDPGPPAPKPIVCPELHPYGKLGPTSVSVDDLHLGESSGDVHWTADKVYLIFRDFKVEKFKLTVDPGTTICVSNQAQIYVGEGTPYPGELHLNGTAESPVTITAFASSEDPSKPDAPHGGIKLDTYQGSTISYTNIWYGGAHQYAFELTDTARDDETMQEPTKPLLIDHLTIGEVQSRGLRIGTEIGIDPASSIRFTGFAPPDGTSPAPDASVEVNWYAAKSVLAALQYDEAKIPEAARRVLLRTGAPPNVLDHDVEIVDRGLPYWAESGKLVITGAEDGSSATLTVGAGVTLHMPARIEVGHPHEGNLVLAGTAGAPVTLTSAEATPAAGDWGGILFKVYDASRSKIAHARILYGGLDNPLDDGVGRCGKGFQGAIQIYGNDLAPYAGPSIEQTEIAYSPSNGVVTSASTNNGSVTTDYASPALGLTFHDVAEANLVVGPCSP